MKTNMCYFLSLNLGLLLLTQLKTLAAFRLLNLRQINQVLIVTDRRAIVKHRLLILEQHNA